MRIFVTADLHYNVRRSREPVGALLDQLAAAQPEADDVLVLVGDIAGGDLDILQQCLKLFEPFPGLRCFVAGNHDLWLPMAQQCHPAPDASLKRYHDDLPAVARACGFAMLDHRPQVIGGVGLAGCIGWYDYAFRDPSLEVPLEFYRQKIAPGAARYYGGYETLLAEYADQLTEGHMEMGVRWMDGWRARLAMSDEEFLAGQLTRLQSQLESLSENCSRIAAFIHHVPFEALLPPQKRDHPLPNRFRFAMAYMGSPKIGELLAACPAVRWVACGHSHWPRREQIGKMETINVGSTYRHKRLEVIDID